MIILLSVLFPLGQIASSPKMPCWLSKTFQIQIKEVEKGCLERAAVLANRKRYGFYGG